MAGSEFEPEPGSFAAHLSAPTYAALRSSGDERRYRSGATLVHQGDPSRHVVVLESGWVKVTATTRRGWEAVLAIRGAGDILGELSALDARPRLGTVTTLTPVTAVLIADERFKACLRADWSLAEALLRHLTANLRESDERRIQFGGSNGDSRLFAILHELCERHGRPTDEGVLIGLPLSQQDLAAAVGVSREVVARSMRLLRSRAIVITRRRQIVVRQPDLLRSLAASVSLSTDPP
ncbi:Crp/Fnr family transcriptional regulator [Actinoplanes sp. TFC3]|uniref:Crp/Fnr family transcriptional regulator n=1 Tax=Actinoplanes sp. TFC3 TaxID=1710355 RepID=UPI00082FBDD3|nr:Crp/Fnr family transcriptional regulator [Actinoplanes sp. TFC3]